MVIFINGKLVTERYLLSIVVSLLTITTVYILLYPCLSQWLSMNGLGRGEIFHVQRGRVLPQYTKDIREIIDEAEVEEIIISHHMKGTSGTAPLIHAPGSYHPRGGSHYPQGGSFPMHNRFAPIQNFIVLRGGTIF